MSHEKNWLKVSKQRPCPICGKPDWCRIAPDGKAVWCGRVNDGGTPASSGSGWIHRLSDDPPPARPARRGPKPTGSGGLAHATAEYAIERIRNALRAQSHQVWTYCRADGSESFRVVRLETPGGKKYRPIHRAADGWRIGDPPGPLPLYRLSELPRAGTVFVPEGEKCADICRGIGLIATTSAHGAQAAEKSDWQPLSGRDVVILPDNDKAGRDYANSVGRLLLQLNPPAIVRILELPGLNEGEDIADWLDRLDGKEPAELATAVVELANRAAVIEAGQLIGGPKLTRLSDVEPQPVEWLWNQRIAIGKLTLLCGDPGLGKSFITLDMAARVSRGEPWPDAPDLPRAPASVILLSAEDDLADTIRPRLDRAGADTTRVVALEAVSRVGQGGKLLERGITLADIPDVERAQKQTPGVRLVIIDPISAYLPADSDSHNNAEIRQVLTPLAKLAAQYRVAIVMVTHLNKSSGSRAMYRATGSLAFTAAARSAWLVTKDTNDPRRRLVLPIKNNLGNDSNGLGYSIVDGAVAWEPDPVAMTADEALAQEAGACDGRGTKRDAAADWLIELLRAGPVAAADVEQQAGEAGLSWSTIRRAADALRVKRRKRNFGAGWEWALPEDAQPPPAQRPGAADVSAFGKGEHLRIAGTENAGGYTLPDTPFGEDAQRLAGTMFDTRKAG